MEQPPSSSLSLSSYSSSSSSFFCAFWTFLEWVRTCHWQNFNHNRLDSCSSDHVSKSEPQICFDSFAFPLSWFFWPNRSVMTVQCCVLWCTLTSSPWFLFTNIAVLRINNLSRTRNCTEHSYAEVDTWQTAKEEWHESRAMWLRDCGIKKSIHIRIGTESHGLPWDRRDKRIPLPHCLRYSNRRPVLWVWKLVLPVLSGHEYRWWRYCKQLRILPRYSSVPAQKEYWFRKVLHHASSQCLQSINRCLISDETHIVQCEGTLLRRGSTSTKKVLNLIAAKKERRDNRKGTKKSTDLMKIYRAYIWKTIKLPSIGHAKACKQDETWSKTRPEIIEYKNTGVNFKEKKLWLGWPCINRLRK